jgi:D-3-phosphoglycerate dehydrogenase
LDEKCVVLNKKEKIYSEQHIPTGAYQSNLLEKLAFMKILFLDTVHPILSERLSEAGYSCIDATQENKQKCLELLHDVQGVVLRSRFTLDASFLDHAPQLQFIARSGAGMENIDVDYCQKRGITLHNAPEGNRNAVGEHALGMLLSLLNNLQKADKEVRAGKWDREGNRGTELDGKTIGIIGYGNNGRAFAKKLRGFDVKVVAYDKYKKDFGDHFVLECTLPALLKQADIISFHIPQNPETLFMVDEQFIAQIEKPVYLLNLSRGKIIQTYSLVKNLKNGRILGAGLDVLEYEKTSFETFFDAEIPSDLAYLLSAENVILTPHIGGWTHESYYKLSAVLADKILDTNSSDTIH